MKGVIKGYPPNERYYLDNVQVSREEFDKVFPDQPLGDGSSLLGWKPLASDALAVHPDQAKEATEASIRDGVPTHFGEDGRPVFTSREHRKNFCRARGVFDRNAGYGDAAPR